MATTFNMLRANDLIWSFVVNNYLLGKDPFPFDLLYWNSDSTRMPARDAQLLSAQHVPEEPAGAARRHQLDGVPIDLGRITVPAYFISTREDHIAPWKSTYAATQLLGGKKRFVLAGSGHIAGMVNPPAARQVRLLDQRRPAARRRRTGSLAGDRAWRAPGGRTGSRWVASHGGDKVPARQPGDGKLAVIEDAPGQLRQGRRRADRRRQRGRSAVLRLRRARADRCGPGGAATGGAGRVLRQLRQLHGAGALRLQQARDEDRSRIGDALHLERAAVQGEQFVRRPEVGRQAVPIRRSRRRPRRPPPPARRDAAPSAAPAPPARLGSRSAAGWRGCGRTPRHRGAPEDRRAPPFPAARVAVALPGARGEGGAGRGGCHREQAVAESHRRCGLARRLGRGPPEPEIAPGGHPDQAEGDRDRGEQCIHSQFALATT